MVARTAQATTRPAHASVARGLRLSETDADHDLSYRFVRQTSAGVTQHILRRIDGNNLLYLEFGPTWINLRQRDGGTLTTLDSQSTTVAQNTWYNVRAVLEGSSVKVWFGAEGASFDEIFSATTTELTTATAAYFRASTNSEFAWDDIRLIAGTRSTVETFTHNNANEQLTHTKNGVVTDMEYDAWGRMTKRDDGTHEATYGYRYGGKLYSVTSDFPGEGSVTYETGGDGKRRSRVAGVEETWYNWGKGWAKISEEVGSDGVGDLLTSWIAGDAGAVLGDSPATGIYSFTTRDSLGSSRGMWNASGENISKTEYDPYGNIYNLHTTSSLDDSHRFANVTKEGPTQLLYAPFRLYNPDTGRWLSRDPLGMVDGPNVYVYALSNPVSYKDSLGLSVIYDLGQDSEPGDKMKELLECISKALGVDIVVNGGHRTPKSKHYREGSNHNNGNAADIRGKEGDPSSCDVSGAARKCAEDSGLTGFRACRRISTGHTHIDFGSEKTADCSKWKDKKGNVLYEECCKD